MSDTESHQAYIDASEASIPAENGPREVANDPPPLGSAEERENDPGVVSARVPLSISKTIPIGGLGCR